MRTLGIVATAVAVSLALGACALASTYSVNSTADAVDQTPGNDLCATADGKCTLRAAVQEANAHAGPDAISLPPGVFVLGLTTAGEELAATGDLDVTEELTVNGAGQDASIIDGFRADRIFHVFGAGFTLRDVTLRNGLVGGGVGGAVFQEAIAPMTIERAIFTLNSAPAGGAILQNDGPLTIVDSTFETNVGSTGAGVLVGGTGAVSITNSTFTSNSSGPGVAAGLLLGNSGGAATVQGCTFSRNLAAVGPSLLSSSASLTLTDSIFEENTGTTVGGGPMYSGPGDVVFTNVRSTGNVSQQGAGGYVVTGAGLTVSGSEFSDNVSFGIVGGFYFEATTAAAIQGSAFRRNGAVGVVGGLYGTVSAGTISLTDVETRDNSATTAGGMYVTASDALSFTRVRAVSNGAANGIAGGIHATAGTDFGMVDSTVDGNIASQVGGIYATVGGATTITGSTISNNRAAGIGAIGGAYFIAGGASSVTNSTFSGNVADLQVGGVYSSGDFTYRNVTFANNDAPMASAILNSGTLSMTSSIVAGPAVSHCEGNAITSLGFNIDSTTTCNLADATDRSNLDPQLGPLQDNGGPTFTHLAGTGSPALDTGNATGCPATDQRGQARPTDADGNGTATCDVGATEFFDLCPADPDKTAPGVCGCGAPDTDAADANGVVDCLVNAEFKARLAHGKDMVNALTGDASDDAMAQELSDMTGGLPGYVAVHPDLQFTSTKPKPSKLLKRLQKSVKKAVKAKGRKVAAAKKRALKAFDTLDALVAPQA